MEIFNAFVGRFPHLLRVRDSRGWCCLHVAAAEGWIDMSKAIYEKDKQNANLKVRVEEGDERGSNDGGTESSVKALTIIQRLYEDVEAKEGYKKGWATRKKSNPEERIEKNDGVKYTPFDYSESKETRRAEPGGVEGRNKSNSDMNKKQFSVEGTTGEGKGEEWVERARSARWGEGHTEKGFVERKREGEGDERESQGTEVNQSRNSSDSSQHQEEAEAAMHLVQGSVWKLCRGRLRSQPPHLPVSKGLAQERKDRSWRIPSWVQGTHD